MAVIDVVIATYRGIAAEAYSPLLAMIQHSNCFCRDHKTGAPLHPGWKCTNGKHSVRMTPPIYSSSVVHWARNQVISQALYGQPEDGRPPAEYLLLMDDDMVVQPDFLSRMVSYKIDIVCGICTVRRDPPRPNIRYWNEDQARFYDPVEWEWDSQKLMEIDAAGAAFMLVKRKVFERMGQAYLDCEFEIAEDVRKGLDTPAMRDYWAKKSDHRKANFVRAFKEKAWGQCDQWWFQFAQNVHDKQIGELGEDLTFCWKAKQLGFRIFADPQIQPGHLGQYGYGVQDYRSFVEQAKAAGLYKSTEEPNKVALVPSA
jgi:cellulose synthase/poly-beta-1,6-N-acetylglucosamine synthase-like glycosyltransferase